jgi:hypothetical protein
MSSDGDQRTMGQSLKPEVGAGPHKGEFKNPPAVREKATLKKQKQRVPKQLENAISRVAKLCAMMQCKSVLITFQTREGTTLMHASPDMLGRCKDTDLLTKAFSSVRTDHAAAAAQTYRAPEDALSKLSWKEKQQLAKMMGHHQKDKGDKDDGDGDDEDVTGPAPGGAEQELSELAPLPSMEGDANILSTTVGKLSQEQAARAVVLALERHNPGQRPRDSALQPAARVVSVLHLCTRLLVCVRLCASCRRHNSVFAVSVLMSSQ